MFRLVEALNFRCFHHIRQAMRPFHVLVGPNASGKSSFLDIIAFVSDLVRRGEALPQAVWDRTPNFLDLVWMHKAQSFELVVEAKIPQPVKDKLANGAYESVRYELEVGLHPQTAELCLRAETMWLLPSDPNQRQRTEQPTLFPFPQTVPTTIIKQPQERADGWKKVVSKSLDAGNDYFISENKRWTNAFKFGPARSALGNLPEDEERFPVGMWFRGLLSDGVRVLRLNSEAMRRPCPPGSPRAYQPDGSNLPLVVEQLARQDPGAMDEWIQHLRTCLPSLRSIRTVERPEDRHSYLMIGYDSGLEIPSWSVSDGTLRVLAMTLLAYAPNLRGPILIEEPENGIHPKAVETVYQSLRSIEDVQVLAATHSPVVVGLAEPRDLLCFGLTPDGAAVVLGGEEHPRLRDWQKEVDLGTFFASGVLG